MLPDAAKIETSPNIPNVMIIEQSPKKGFHFNLPHINLPKKGFIIGVLLCLGAAGSFAVYRYTTLAKQQPSSAAIIPEIPERKVQLEQLITSTFTDPKDQNINSLLMLAKDRKDLESKYFYYLKAYQSMKESYERTKDPKAKVRLDQMRDYLKFYPQYQQSDTTIVP